MMKALHIICLFCLTVLLAEAQTEAPINRQEDKVAQQGEVDRKVIIIGQDAAEVGDEVPWYQSRIAHQKSGWREADPGEKKLIIFNELSEEEKIAFRKDVEEKMRAYGEGSEAPKEKKLINLEGVPVNERPKGEYKDNNR